MAYADAAAFGVDFLEECDDGNLDNGDGCTDLCVVEYLYTCVGIIPDVCTFSCIEGLNPYTHHKDCDDGTSAVDDGCNSQCQVQDGFECLGGTDTTADVCTEICGDGHNYGLHACDDGNVNDGDGCSATCTIEAGYACAWGNRNFADLCWSTAGCVGNIFD